MKLSFHKRSKIDFGLYHRNLYIADENSHRILAEIIYTTSTHWEVSLTRVLSREEFFTVVEFLQEHQDEL